MNPLRALPLLEPHLPTVLFSTSACFLAQYLTHRVGRRWPHWTGYEPKLRNGIATHVVSMIHAVIIIPLAFRALGSQVLENDPVFGYDPFVGHVLAISSGYFVWDTIDSMLHSTIGFVVHGACCLAVYLFSFRPFLAGFGPPFLLWELSTPLLNIHWFMDRMGYSARYPTFFLLNALAFMLVFFLARICYGAYESLYFFSVLYKNWDEIPLHLHLIYGVGNLSLNALNWLWFGKMLFKMQARLSGKDQPRSAKAPPETAPLLPGHPEEKLDEKDNASEVGSEGSRETLALPAEPPSPIAAIKKTGEGW